jgi:predicted ATP-dependent endonuclease of OLD family
VAHDPPAALHNLVRLACLDLPKLLTASRSDNHGLVETLTDAASNRLHKVLKQAWQQPDVEVHVRLNDDTLRVMIQTDGTGFWEIADRSDGLRAFVALVAFVSNRDKEAILFVDEAEIHLHYDAQADLVQMLERQPLVRQVIYTTHSAGCLPEDLTSVRTVVPQPNSEISHLRNWFWEDQEAGFAPLLTGMGAATLAFVPTRFAVLVEGPTDLIPLPTLMREASGHPSLGFQIAPGLAGAAPSEISSVDMQGPRIVYLLDNDDGGDGIARQLGHAGIGQDRCVRISRIRNTVIEDLVEPEIYLAAIKAELTQSGHEPTPSSELEKLNRPCSVEEWCETSGFSAPVKRAVAQRLLEQAREGAPLLTTEGSNELRYLLSQIMSSFDSSPNASGTEDNISSR